MILADLSIEKKKNIAFLVAWSDLVKVVNTTSSDQEIDITHNS